MSIGISNSQYATQKKDLFDFITQMRALGVDVDVDIPAIVAIGWQSAGKSSLIEAISGIKLPRASNTCTRCPTECQLEQSDTPWKCNVSLRFSTDHNGNRLPTTRTVTFGQTITDKPEVTDRIKRAQRAILSPSVPPDSFLTGDGIDTESEFPFSYNCIILHISGPDMTDLNFIDLPGLFSGGRNEDIDLIRNLAVSYIEKPSCLILLTVACETDFINQGAHRLAKEFDPDGARTIGVLTKPDRIPPAEEGNWLPFIRGERENTTSWFCVKCPNSQAITAGVTWEQARTAESTFFSSTPPWSTLETAYKKRLGTENLTTSLSDKLCEVINNRLPHIEQELKKRLEQTKGEMGELPDPPSSTPLKVVVHLIDGFIGAVEKQSEGEPGPNGLLQQIRPCQNAFRIAIRETAPCFVPRFRGEPVEMETIKDERHRNPTFLIGEEPSGEIGLDDGEDIFIDDVLKMAESAVTRELPCNYPFIVQEGYIIERVDQWNEPAQILFNSTREILKEMTLGIVDEHFEHYIHGGLKQRVRNIVETHLELCAKETSKRIKFLLAVEKKAFTENKHYFRDYRGKFLAFYKGLYHSRSNDFFINRLQQCLHTSSPLNSALDSIIANLHAIGFRDVTPLQLARLQPSEDAEDALKIMADVRGYFQVAYKRFVDNVPKAIDEELVLGIVKGLHDVLMSELGIDSPDVHERCARYIAEHPRIAEKRDRLSARKDRLDRAIEELRNIFV